MFKDYPDILRPGDIWIDGITQDPTTGDYYLCKTSKDYYPTTGNKYLDLFLMELHSKVQWMEFLQIANIYEMLSPQH